MFIKKITIKNFKLFSSDKNFDIDKVNVEFAFADGAKKVIVCKAKPNS